MATVGRRGRFQVAEPLFERATPVQLDGRRAQGGRAGPARLRQERRTRGAHHRAPGRGPGRARGADAGPRPAPLVPAPGRGRGRRLAQGDRWARGPARPAHLHHRSPGRARLRRRHLRAARGRPRPAVGAHRRRHRLRATRHRHRRRGRSPGHQRVRAGGRGADAARGAVEPGVLAARRRGPPGRDRRAGDPGHRRALPALHALPDPQRRPADLSPGRRRVRGSRPGGGAVGRAARGRARGGRRAACPPRRARLPGGELRGAGVRVRPGRPRDGRASRAADRVAPGDRGADGARQRAGGGPPGRLAHADPLPGAREARPAVGGVHGRAARLPRRAHPAGARAHEPPAGRRPGGRGLAPGGRPRGAHRPRPRGLRLVGAALSEAGLLHAAQPGPRRAGQPALLPLHLADPAAPGHRGPPRPPGRARPRRRRAARSRTGGGGGRELGPRARGDDHRARRRRRLPGVPARARALRGGSRGRASRARWSA